MNALKHVNDVHLSKHIVFLSDSFVTFCLLDLLKSLVHIVKIVHGHPCTITPRQSRVMLHVPEGLHGIILGNVFHNFNIFRHCVKKTDCNVSPMCEFEFHSYDNIPEGAFIKIEVPHIVKNYEVSKKIRVMSRDRYQESIEYAQRLEPGQKPRSGSIYYRYTEEYIEIFTHHFSQFIVYAEKTNLEEVITRHNCCTTCVETLVFVKWNTSPVNFLDVIVFVCNLEFEKVFSTS